jgi:hypothetical protein
VRIELEAASQDLMEAEQPGWLGLLLRGATRGIEVAAQAVDPRARLDGLDTRHGRLTIDLSIVASATPASAPREAAFMGQSTATGWVFDTSEARLGS